MKILVADDEKQFANLLAEFLCSLGHEVVKAYNGKNALKECDVNEFDLFLLDIFMPDMDGFELIAELKRKYVSPKIIAMSGMARFGNDFLGAAEKLGANVALIKPFELSHLQAEIAHLFDEQ